MHVDVTRVRLWREYSTVSTNQRKLGDFNRSTRIDLVRTRAFTYLSGLLKQLLPMKGALRYRAGRTETLKAGNSL